MFKQRSFFWVSLLLMLYLALVSAMICLLMPTKGGGDEMLENYDFIFKIEGELKEEDGWKEAGGEINKCDGCYEEEPLEGSPFIYSSFA